MISDKKLRIFILK